jgi:hypothetical protein
MTDICLRLFIAQFKSNLANSFSKWSRISFYKFIMQETVYNNYSAPQKGLKMKKSKDSASIITIILHITFSIKFGRLVKFHLSESLKNNNLFEEEKYYFYHYCWF